MKDIDDSWLTQRRYDDLDPRAEQALRKAGLHFSDESAAEAYLQQAAGVAPDHEAVLIAHYRFYLYKHRYPEAVQYAKACVALAARQLGVEEDPFKVSEQGLALDQRPELARFWLFSCQALGYVLLRLGQENDGRALLQHLVRIDKDNEIRTVELCQAIDKAEEEDED